MTPVERPLALGEVFAETIRIYGERFWAASGIGAVAAAAFVVGGLVHPAAAIVLLSLVFTGAWAAATRLVSGDRFGEAWAQVALHAPVLLVFTIVASLPFALAVSQLFLIIFAVGWIALTGFSIPASVAEAPGEGEGVIRRIAGVLQRSVEISRAEYFHAAGVIAALVGVYVVCGFLIAGLLVGFADNSGFVAVTLVQLVLAPFFFLGLAVLYFEQRARVGARAVSSRGRR